MSLTGISGRVRETEADLATWLEDLLHRFHYQVAHFRPARTESGWRTAVSCDGAGFPDYVAIGPELREGNRRHLVIELKSETGKVFPKQRGWLDLFSKVAGTETYLVRPSDRQEFTEILMLGHEPNTLERLELKTAWVNGP